MKRDEIAELLPFYVNGSLDDAERAAVDAALAEDAGLVAEAQALATLRATMQAETVDSPGAFGLARLMREIERETAPARPPMPVRSGVSGLWRIAAVLALVVIAGQALWTASRQPGPAVSLAGGETGPALVVAFAPGATEADLRALLLDLDLVIVDGPSALGLYRLVPASGSAEDLAAAAAALAAAADLVDSVEPEGE